MNANVYVHDSGMVSRASAWNSERNVHETSRNSPGADFFTLHLCARCVVNIALAKMREKWWSRAM